MGYTTNFSGAIVLSKPLTFAQAKTLLEFNEDPDGIPQPHPGSYMQWVPTESLQAIVWDQGEKFYEYTEWLQWLVNWLQAEGITCSGTIYWSGESVRDSGVLTVADGVVTAAPNVAPTANAGAPLTMKKLGDMAIAALAKA